VEQPFQGLAKAIVRTDHLDYTSIVSGSRFGYLRGSESGDNRFIEEEPWADVILHLNCPLSTDESA
jgi:hypothetical protein